MQIKAFLLFYSAEKEKKKKTNNNLMIRTFLNTPTFPDKPCCSIECYITFYYDF